MKILVRPYKPADLSLVFDSWLNSWRTNKYAGTIPNHLYFETQRALIEGLLQRGAGVHVVHPETDPDHILGWACFEQKGKEPEGIAVLHYLYVKDPYLQWPVEALLLDSLPGNKPGFLTHKIHFKSLRAWKHAPEMARRKAL